jgi:hypothetical protein
MDITILATAAIASTLPLILLWVADERDRMRGRPR